MSVIFSMNVNVNWKTETEEKFLRRNMSNKVKKGGVRVKS